MTNTIVEKIKQRGYWVFRIRPKVFIENAIENLNACHILIRDNKVSLRGWDFPHYPDYSNECTNADGYIECSVDWSYFVEYWRLYQSAQFYFLKGCWEDWHEQAEGLFRSTAKLQPKTSIDLLSVVYTLTEAFEFAARLASRGLLGNASMIELSLNNCKGRKLITLDPGRFLTGDYRCGVDIIPFKIEISNDELLRDSALLSRKAMHKIFELFNWRSVGVNQFQQEQENFLYRRR
jgi:hypothetical protein